MIRINFSDAFSFPTSEALKGSARREGFSFERKEEKINLFVYFAFSKCYQVIFMEEKSHGAPFECSSIRKVFDRNLSLFSRQYCLLFVSEDDEVDSLLPTLNAYLNLW